MLETVLARPIPDRNNAHVWVSQSAAGGWDLAVEIDGRMVVREHYDDWHRVERRRALLRGRLIRPTGEPSVTLL
jgi:hypothetical protein